MNTQVLTPPDIMAGPLPDAAHTPHAGRFYALQDRGTGALLSAAGPASEGDGAGGAMMVRLFATFADAALARSAWCGSRFQDDLVPPTPGEALRILALSREQALALREIERAARAYRAAGRRPAPRPEGPAPSLWTRARAWIASLRGTRTETAGL